MDLTKFGNASKFPLTYMLLRNFALSNEKEGFEVATWLDPEDEQKHARVVIGPKSIIKTAWGSVGGVEAMSYDQKAWCLRYRTKLAVPYPRTVYCLGR